MRIIIGADIYIQGKDLSFFQSKNIEGLLGNELKEKLLSSDFRIFNLEGPVTKSNFSIQKCGPNMKMPVSIMSGLKLLNPSLLTLANNHIMDYGKDGYIETVLLLNENKIPYVGVGDSIYSVKKNHIFEKDNLKIGVYACAEHEFSIASSIFPGANPYDSLYTFDDISELKKICDYVIVLYHGGKECYRYPSPELQRTFHKMVDKGASLVIAQHSHCIGCYEHYKEATLVYGQGNFIFDDENNDFFNSGLLIELSIKKENDLIKTSIEYIPFERNINGGIKVSKDKSVLNNFNERSQQIKCSDFIENSFKSFSRENALIYLDAFQGSNLFYRILKKIFGKSIILKFYSKTEIFNRLRNYIECESHKEVLLNILKNING